jgi:hypothetical protein
MWIVRGDVRAEMMTIVSLSRDVPPLPNPPRDYDTTATRPRVLITEHAGLPKSITATTDVVASAGIRADAIARELRATSMRVEEEPAW